MLVITNKGKMFEDEAANLRAAMKVMQRIHDLMKKLRISSKFL
jgi:hypothetical protein